MGLVTERFKALQKGQTQIQVLWDELGRRTFPRKPNASSLSALDFNGLIA